MPTWSVAVAVLLGVAALVLPTLAVLRLTRVAASHRRHSLRAVGALTAAWVVCWAFGAAARLGREHRVHERGRPGRPGGASRAIRPPRSRALQRPDPARPLSATSPPTSSSPASAARTSCSCSSRATGRLAVEGSSFSPEIDAVARHRDPPARRRRLLVPKRVAHLGDLRRRKLAGARHAAVGDLDRQPSALQRARRERPAHAHEGVRARRMEDGRRHAVEHPGTGRRDPRSTATTRSTTAGTSGIAARSTGSRRCPTSTSCSPCSGSSWRSPHRRPLFAEVDLVSSHTPWTRIPPLIGWNRVGDGSIFNRLPIDETGLTDTQAGLRAGRSSTRSARCSRSSSTTAARTSCSSCSATTSPRASSPGTARVMTCRSRSSPTIRQ